MIRLLAAGLLSCLVSLSVAAAAPPTVLIHGIPHQALFDLAFDGAQGIAVGAGGQILRSGDAGKTWTAERSPITLGLLGVALRGGHSIAVGQTGSVLVRNGAEPWREVKVDNAERLLSVDLNASGLAVAVGSFGTVLKSTDYGETWTSIAPDWPRYFVAEKDTLGEGFSPHVYGVSVSDSGRVLIVGELSMILARAPGGSAWTLVHRGTLVDGRPDPSLFNIKLRGDGSGFAVGQAGAVLRTRDDGASWTRLDSGSPAILLGIEAGGSGHVLVTGIREVIVSDNDGDSWTPIHAPDIKSGWYSAVAKPAGAPYALAVGHAGTILSIPD